MLDLPNPLTPRDAKDVLDAVRDAAEAARPLEVLGHGTKRAIGQPVAARQVLDLSQVSGVIFYEPDELVLKARAGTPLADIDALLEKSGQELAFEPMDFGPLFGAPRDGGTIGGTLAANISGPRRIKAGAARDHVLGIEAVSGRGEMFKSGGRVVKNVTGYDLSKGLANSWGTLAVLTHVTFKTLPRAEAASTLAVFGLDDAAGVEILCAAMGSAGEISGAAHLPASVAPTLPQLSAYGFSCTLLRLEGFRPSVLYRAERVATLFGRSREVMRIDDTESTALWRSIRDVTPFADRDSIVWRISVAPAQGPAFIAALPPKFRFRHFYDWSGGLIWLELMDEKPDAAAREVRAAVKAVGGGHAMLIRAPYLSENIARFEPQPQTLAALTARLKHGFDPLNILNPGADGLMQTHFSAQQLADPETAQSARIIRKCVHCGFCLATCPTYLELGNELDSPRGRIYLIKDMLENGKAATAQTALHVDRCLSCLSCATTCPSGVDYMHLIDHARAHIEATYRRPLADRLVRRLLASILPYPARFRLALAAAKATRALAPLLEALGARRLAAMLFLSASVAPRAANTPPPVVEKPSGRRVALLAGCAQSVLDPGINAAAERLLARLGIAIVRPHGETCCGALVHHMGRVDEARAFARRNVDAWMREIDNGLEAILITTSGCGTTIKDYGHLLGGDPAYAAKAAEVARRALDISEYLAGLDLPVASLSRYNVAYHAACSLQHGQNITLQPRLLLERAGFAVSEIPEGHICCGSAGTYNILQPEIARQLRDRKLRNIALTGASVIASGNIGCMTQLASATSIPIVHLVELLDWAYGGPQPPALNALA